MRYENFIKKITYEDIAKASPLAYVVWAFDDFRVVDWNKSAEGIFGWGKEEVLGKNFFDFLIPEKVKEKVREVVEKIKASKLLTHRINENLTKDGRIIKCEWWNTPIKDEKGRITLVISIARDITEEVQKEREIEESRKRLYSIVESTPNAIVTVDEKGSIIYWNKAAEEIFGYSEDEVVGKKVTIIMPQRFYRAFEERFRKAISLGHPTKEAIEVPALRKDGTEIFVEWTFSSWRQEGKLFFTGIGKDINRRKKFEEKLRESEEKYHRLVEQANDGICIVQDGILKYLNRQLARMWGGSVQELTGRPFAELVPSGGAPFIAGRYRKRMKGENISERYELALQRKDGGKFFVEVNANLIIFERRPADLVIVRDITGRKRQEEKTKRLYSMQKAIRQINQVLLKVRKESELFKLICKILVDEIEDFKFCWVGLVEEGFKVRPVAFAGFEEGYLSQVKVKWDSSEYAKGPTGMAIKRKKPFVVNDIENDPRYSLWRKEALERGYRSSAAFPIMNEDKVIGTVNIYSSQRDFFGKEEVRFLEEAAGDIAIGIRSLRLERELKKTVEELEKTTEGIIFTVSKIVEARDPYTAGHQKKVAELARAIAREMKLPKDKVEGVYMAGMIHDIGKIYVPSEILSKPGRLNQIEFSLIKTHSQYGYNMLKDIDFPWPVALSILQHHERVDGSGYPQGLKGDEIILEAKILAVADVVEAISSHRPYRPSLGIDKALEEIEENRGKLYDPEVVDACLRVFRKRGFKFSS